MNKCWTSLVPDCPIILLFASAFPLPSPLTEAYLCFLNFPEVYAEIRVTDDQIISSLSLCSLNRSICLVSNLRILYFRVHIVPL